MSNLPLAELRELCKQQASHSDKQGFWSIDFSEESPLAGMNPFDLLIGTKLGLISTEVAEATEEFRCHGPTPHFEEELADIVIRVMDVAGFYDFDLGEAIRAKMAKNAERPYRHGKRF